MKVLHLVGNDADGNLVDFHIINPMNVVVNEGTISKPGHLKDGKGNPIPVKEKCTFVRIEGQPMFVKNTVEEVVEQAEKL